jgi:Flp pilus assembly protein TadD
VEAEAVRFRAAPREDALVNEDVAEPIDRDIVEAEAERRLLGRLDHALRGLRTAEVPTGGPPAASPATKRLALALALGVAHLNAGMLDTAERELRDALGSEPASAEAHENLALALARLGRLDAAAEQLRAAAAAGASVSPRVREEIARLRAALEL